MSTNDPVATAVAVPRRLGAHARRTAAGPHHDRALRVAVVVVAGHLLALTGYLLVREPSVLAARYLVYPVVWTGLTAYALARVPWGTLRTAPPRRLALAPVVAVAYLALVGWLTGLVGPASEVAVARLVVAPPGWGPLVLYDGSLLALQIVPFTAVGAVGLAALVGVAAAGTGSPLGGLVGLFSCVGCTLSAVGALVAVVLGGGSTLAAAAVGASYDLSTAVFVCAMLLLVGSVVGAE